MKILLIDDDKLTLKAMKQLLLQLGHHVVVASNKLNALKKLKEEEIDCVVSDVQMPDTTPGELFTAIKQGSERTPVIFISTRADNPEIDETLLNGADAFIPKPVKPALLDSIIRRLTERNQQHA